jgi:hypothetical protein
MHLEQMAGAIAEVTIMLTKATQLKGFQIRAEDGELRHSSSENTKLPKLSGRRSWARIPAPKTNSVSEAFREYREIAAASNPTHGTRHQNPESAVTLEGTGSRARRVRATAYREYFGACGICSCERSGAGVHTVSADGGHHYEPAFRGRRVSSRALAHRSDSCVMCFLVRSLISSVTSGGNVWSGPDANGLPFGSPAGRPRFGLGG